MRIFKPADILLPDTSRVPSYKKWAVVACDQFTSQPKYWEDVRAIAGSQYSTCNLILPEAELSSKGADYIDSIHKNMAACLEDDIFIEYYSAMVYVERTQSDGSVRRGIAGCIDLETYDYAPESSALIRATEKTVIERIPPRVAVRKGAPLELSHVLLYADDENDTIMAPLTAAKEDLPCLYDFDLMLSGGHITGYLIIGSQLDALMGRIDEYYKKQDAAAAEAGVSPVYFTVADGNHSLASAKVCYEEAKAEGASMALLSRLRYAMVELENLHDESQVILPIHRLITGTDKTAFLSAAEKALTTDGSSVLSLKWISGNDSGCIPLDAATPGEAITNIQTFIDDYLTKNPGSVDYIHGDDTLAELSASNNSIGLFMPAITKDGFFSNIMTAGVYPRKTFSVGEATDKRYYLEVRNLY